MSAFWWQPFAGSIFAWWLVVTALGWIAYPLVARVSTRLPDRGLGLSKLAGIALLAFANAWCSFVLARFGDAPTGPARFGLWAGAIGLLSIVGPLLWRDVVGLRRRFRLHIVRALAYEAAFLAAFLAFLWLRSYTPDATFDIGWWGAEKWVNMGMLSGLCRNPAIPPVDPWLADMSVNYYYFSQLMWASVARLAGVLPEVAFNLALATLFALLATLSFSVGWAVSGRRRGGAWALFLVALMGTPATWAQAGPLLEAARTQGVGMAARIFDFWAPSDVIPNTRNEFPAFNWLLGDLHAHGTGLLLLLTAVALLVQWERLRAARKRHMLLLCAALALLPGLMWATNAWDLIVLVLLGSGWLLFARKPRGEGLRPKKAIAARLATGLLLVGIGVGVLVGFYTHFTQPPLNVQTPLLARLPSVLGILGSVGWVTPEQRTTAGQWWAYWGFLAAVPTAAGVLWAMAWLGSGGKRRTLIRAARSHRPYVALLLVGLFGFLVRLYIGERPWVGLAAGAGLAACIVLLARTAGKPWQRRTLLLLGAALGCQFASEFIFLDDPIGPPNDRYNTLFKLYYGAWALAALAAATILSRLPDWIHAQAGIARRSFQVIAALFVTALIVGGSAYPILGVARRLGMGMDRISRLERSGVKWPAIRRTCRTLDSLAFMALPNYAPEDLKLGRWMRENLPDARRVAEMTGKSYSMVGRMSVISGIPSFMGWESHETQWRGPTFAKEEWRLRSNALRVLYGSEDPNRALAVCRKFDIRYVVVGSLERDAYSEKALAKFEKISRRAHREGRATLYEIIPAQGARRDGR